MSGQAAPRRVTSGDIARELGISRATVSYVLNDSPGRAISEQTRRRVLETASRLGHVPSAHARALRSGRSSIVLALLPTYSRGFISDSILEALDVALADNGYALAAHRYDGDRRNLTELWGLISPAIVVALGGLSLPDEAVIEHAQSKLVRLDRAVDHRLSGYLQIEHLVERGHRSIGYLDAASSSVASVAVMRLDGAREAARHFGLPELLVHGVDLVDPGMVGALDALLGAGVTGVATHNDFVAAMLLLEMGQRRLHAPEDLAVIGSDDAPLARSGMSTVGIDISAYQAFAVESVLCALANEPVPTEHPQLVRLIARETT